MARGLLLLLLCLSTAAGVAGDICGDPSKQLHWEGECKPGDSVDGALAGPSCSCSGGKMHGQGTLRDLGRSIYTGGMASGEKSGLGSIIHKRPIQYKGGYQDGKMHGLGCLKLGLVVYDGYFRDGKQVGYGSLLTAKKEHYAGEFEHGQKGGLGVMEFSHSNKYTGHWDRDQRVGCGVFYQSTFLNRMFGDALFPPTRMAGKWIRCNPKDECTFDLLRVFTGFDLGCDCMPDGVKLLRHRDAPPSHADIECGNRNEREAQQKQAVALEKAQRAKIQALSIASPPDRDFGVATKDPPPGSESHSIHPEHDHVEFSILHNPYMALYVLAFLMAVQSMFPRFIRKYIFALMLFGMIYAVAKYLGPHDTVQFFSGGQIKNHEADNYFGKLPSFVRPGLFVPRHGDEL